MAWLVGGTCFMAFGVACGGEVLLGGDRGSTSEIGDGGEETSAPPERPSPPASPTRPSWSNGSRGVDPGGATTPGIGGTLVVEPSDDITALAVDATDLWWTLAGSYYPVPASDGAVERAPKSGGAITRVFGNQTRPLAIARSGEWVYWAGLEQDNPPLNRGVLDGGYAESIDWKGGHVLLQDDANLYVVNRTIRRVSKQTGAVSVLHSTSAPGFGAVALGGNRVFFVEIGERDIQSVPIDGGAVETVVTRIGPPLSTLAADASRVYWSNPGEAAIHAAPHGGGPSTKVVDTAGPPNQVLLSDGSLYWTIPAGAGCYAGVHDGGTPGPSMQTSSTAGGPARTIAFGYPGARAVAFDAASVYWVSGSGSCQDQRAKIWRAPR